MGEVESIKAMGTTAATLLGGFALASVAVLVTAERQPMLGDWALIAFVVAAAGFVFSVQFTSAGLGHAATPEERLMWRPQAGTDAEVLASLQRIQRMDTRLLQRYIARARWTYRLGLVAFLGGTVLICVPENVNWPRITAAGVAFGALLVELYWIMANIMRRPPQWLLPTYAHPDIWEHPPDDC